MGFARGFWGGLALGFLLGTALRALLSTAFYLSLATLRLNGTAAWTLTLLAPLLAPLLPRTRLPAAVAGLAVAALPWARFTPSFVPLAALASAAGLLAFARLSRAGLVGALAGLALNGLALFAGRSHDPMLSFAALPVALGLALLAALSPRAEPQEKPRLLDGAAWAGLFAAECALLASPFVVAARVGADAWLVAGAGFVGLLAGATLLHRAPGWTLAALALWGLADLAFLTTPLAPLAPTALQLALGAAACRLAPPSGLSFAPPLAGALFLLLFFGDPLGEAVWTLVLPLLCAAPLAVALLRRVPFPSPRGRLVAPVLLGLLLIPLAPAPAPVEPHEGASFTVVNWNVHQGFGNRGALDPHAYAEVLRALRPDVVVLQESHTTALSSGGLDAVRFLAHELGLHVAATGRGVAVLSRFPSAAEEPVVGPWSVAVPLDVHGRTVWVEGVHLARSSVERRAQVEEALARANATPGPRILAGDLNSCAAPTCFGGRPSDRLHDLLAVVYRDAWAALHDPRDPAGHTHPAWAPGRRIDVVMTRGLEPLEARVVRDEATLRGSDHLPVVVRLRAPG